MIAYKILSNKVKWFKCYIHTYNSNYVKPHHFKTSLWYCLKQIEIYIDLRTRLKNSICKNLPFCKIRVISKSSAPISSVFQFKDKMSYFLRSNFIYKFSYDRCNATYYSKICQHLSVKVGQHSGVSPLTRKKSKSKKPTALKIILYPFMTLKFLTLEFHRAILFGASLDSLKQNSTCNFFTFFKKMIQTLPINDPINTA